MNVERAPGAGDGPVVVPLPGDESPARAFAACLRAGVVTLESRRFPDGERYLRLQGEVHGRVAVVYGTLAPPDEAALSLRFTADLLRELGATRVLLVLPYLPYMRQDARFHPGEAITSTSFARFLSESADGLVTVDPHLHRHASLDEIYTIPSRVVPAAPAIARWIRRELAAPVVVGPDEESAQWVADVAGRAGAPWFACTKQRRGDRDVHVVLPPAADRLLEGRTPVLVDDILSSGRTMAEAVRALREAGAPAPACIAVHGLFADDALPLLAQAGAGRVVTCDTRPGPVADIDLGPDLAQAVRGLAAALA